jgi:radical SAM protein with 4Fe4S-binding SPASM domain
VSWRQAKDIVPAVVGFVKLAAKNGISTVLECPVAPCLFTKRQLRFLAQFVADFNIFRCYPMLDVLPDLSVHYCMGMPIMSRITPEITAGDIYLQQADIAEHFRKRPRAKECLCCEWWTQKLCQGYCLQDRYNSRNPKDRKLLAGIQWLKERRSRRTTNATSLI